jgi:hypothetical protein
VIIRIECFPSELLGTTPEHLDRYSKAVRGRLGLREVDRVEFNIKDEVKHEESKAATKP